MRILFLFCTILFASISNEIKSVTPKTDEEPCRVCEKIENEYRNRIRKTKRAVLHAILGSVDAQEAGVEYDFNIIKEETEETKKIGIELHQLFLENSNDPRVLSSLHNLATEFAITDFVGKIVFNPIKKSFALKKII